MESKRILGTALGAIIVITLTIGVVFIQTKIEQRKIEIIKQELAIQELALEE